MYLRSLLKGKVRERNRKTTLSSRYPKLSSWFLRVCEEDKLNIEKIEHDEDHSGRELDFIAAERSSNTMKKTKYEGKSLSGFVNAGRLKS